MSIITTISLKEEDKAILEEYNLSPSDLIREKVQDIRLMAKKLLLDNLTQAREALAKALKREQQLREFIEAENLMDKFLNL